MLLQEKVATEPQINGATLFVDPDAQVPIRAELFGLEHLEQHGRWVGEQITHTRIFRGRPLLANVLQNANALRQAHRTINLAYQNREILGNDAEWLLDNFHIIGDSLTEIQTDLPAGYYRWLPKLTQGPLAGFPRVYVIALELTAHCDSGLDETNIDRFIQAIQSVTPLTVGEVWAVPIMLRLCLLDNLRRLAEHVVQFRDQRRIAEQWLTQNLPTLRHRSGIDPFELEVLKPHWRDCYLVHLLEGFYEHEALYPGASERLHRCLEQKGCPAGAVLRREKERQAANQVSIGNCVTSLRLLSAVDWPRFFERISHLEGALRRDHSGDYGRQDFATRDRYRHAVEHLARRSTHSELEVAQAVLDLSGQAAERLQRHVGYYLIDEGRAALEARIGYHAPLGSRLSRNILLHPRKWYFGALIGLTSLVTTGLLVTAFELGAQSGWMILLGVLSLIPASELAIGLLNFLIPYIVPPRVLPRMDHREGVRDEDTTFVVIPCLLTNLDAIRALVERLEIHYLSNPEPPLFFGLLTDFSDASTESMPDDEAHLKAAEAGIRELNEKHAVPGHSRFFLFHRKRRWNPEQNCWMGWERKRGKLEEFNRLMKNDDPGTFSSVVGDLATLPPIRFVITLDADTQLPRETARTLIATIAHPLNRPHFDSLQRRVTRGYGVLQPRIGLSLRGSRKSLFARIYSGSVGLDPYSSAVSDTYQDLFGSGSFTGKGIYDLDAFTATTGNAFPDNRILSHDLIEGNYARCGLISDVELLDDFPAHYIAHAQRDHRWARGDWQIVSWLFPYVPAAKGTRRSNTLPMLERWKMFDNLRRSLVSTALVALLVAGWLSGTSPWLWTGFAALVLAWPLCLLVASWPLRGVRLMMAGRYTLPNMADFGATASQAVLSAIFLLDRARNMLDAAGRTLYRLFVSRRHLLEWETAAAAESRLRSSLVHFVAKMWPISLAAGSLAIAVGMTSGAALIAASPFLIGWFVSPLVACFVSRPKGKQETELTKAECDLLRRWARRTWYFFETFVGSEDNWLPPDNYQEDPKNEVAHRTSPTNIGLYLLSCVAAHDLGYITLPQLLERLEKTFGTLAKLERSHGHFYNWYDTITLAPLHPIYLSTVDSGNLTASFIALKQCLLEKIQSPFSVSAIKNGLEDLLGIAEEMHGKAVDATVASRLTSLRLLIGSPRLTIPEWLSWLDQVIVEGEKLHEDVSHLNAAHLGMRGEWLIWIRRLIELARDRLDEISAYRDFATTNDTLDSLTAVAALESRCHRLMEQAEELAASVDFRMLYNSERDLFAIGYNLTNSRIDNAHYDLLASEACLTSYLAIARGDVPRKHWFRLGRPLTRTGGSLALLSWGGTMFEYLMPRLFLKPMRDTLLYESQSAAVAAQIEYARRCRTPWGISESAFNAVDGHWIYQYQAFGAPLLGLKRGLTQDLVVAPYATGLAVMVAPRLSVRNYERLCAEGAGGRYGLFEAIDYTTERLPQNRSSAIVKCFMAHHQGMTLLGITNCLLGDPFPRRFQAEPMMRATELLLQERVPREPVLAEAPQSQLSVRPTFQEASPSLNRRITTPHTAHPRTHMLASAQHSLMITNAGSGLSRAHGLAVTRWREDRTCDAWGQFFYIRDKRMGTTWSAGYQPLRTEADEYEVTYSTDKAVFRRVDGFIETRMEITVSPENHAEVRRLTFANHDTRSHYLEVTSYAEIVIASQAADLAHPAFGKLFLETEFLPAPEALLCRRRPRSVEEKPVWALHVAAVEGRVFGVVEFETDRARFLGRGRSPANPMAMANDAGPLSGTVGPVLDAIFSLRRRILVNAGSSVNVAFTTVMAESREEAISLADHYRDFHGINRAFEMAWAYAQVDLRQLHLSAGDTHLFQRLAAHLWYAGSSLRAAPAILAANHQGQSALWRHGVSGDIPILTLLLEDVEELPLARELLAAHSFWRLKGLAVDLVIVNQQDGGYREDFHQQILALIRSSDERDHIDRPAGVHLRKTTHLSTEDRILLQAAAHVVLVGNRGTLAVQLDRFERQAGTPRITPSALGDFGKPIIGPFRPKGSPLSFENELGGFTADGSEYVLKLTARSNNYRLPPQPWINVMANEQFGTLVSESGGGFTWSTNSQSNRITPWQNDPVTDRPGEIIYVRDEKSGQTWSATPSPCGAPAPFRVRHGQGYTVFEHERDQLHQELTVFVPPNDPVKIFRLKIRYDGDKPRRLTVTFYAEWVLGRSREQTAPYVVSEVDPTSGTLFARCAFRPDVREHISFADVNVRPRSLTADRGEFLGRNGDVTAPIALDHGDLSGKVGAGLDPCVALHVPVLLPPRGVTEIIFLLGEAVDAAEARRLAQYYRVDAQVQKAWEANKEFWKRITDAVTIKTPNTALDMLFNRWLPYQILSCRMWARSGLYQSGGAFGFRDQLQDSLALLYALPEETRKHILRSAARQFPEGDVQHWWHPPSGAGVRTRFSDDFLWLPFAVEQYVRVTGDQGILDEIVPFLKAPLLRPGQEEDFRVPEQSEQSASLYDHCLRAIENGMRWGVHGLPLMGTGDWNDGMNRVGSEGKGESVWAGWFFLTIARDFATICDARGDVERASRFRSETEKLRRNIEESSWDGGWYRRAYFDDGRPLGSVENDECRIDSLPQSWAVISGAGNKERAREAMQAVDTHLVKADDKMVLLFTPPFDHGDLQPGYIKGYLPGIRENGGQYTHAALWVAQAFALLGDGDRAEAVLDMLNPIRHTGDAKAIERYRLEPYVVAADVYSQPPHKGRGGWSWYTGSAGWFYRVVMETLLGFELSGSKLRLQPRLPKDWPGFELTYRFKRSTYRIRVEQVAKGVTAQYRLDGNVLDEPAVSLVDDARPHELVIRVPKQSEPPT